MLDRAHHSGMPTDVGVYTAGTDGVYRLDIATGKVRWCYTEPAPDPDDGPRSDLLEFGPVTVVAGTVYTVAQNGTVYAFNSENGSLRWIHAFDQLKYTIPPIVVNDTVYITGVILSALALTPSKVYVYALGTADGKERARYHVPDDVPGPYDGLDRGVGATIVENTLYLSAAYQLFAIDLRESKELWSTKLQKGLMLTVPQVVDGILYTSTWPIYVEGVTGPGFPETGNVYAYDIHSGEQRWVSSTKITRPSIAPLTVTNGHIYCASDNQLFAFDRQGKLLWKQRTRSLYRLQPQVENGMVYLHDQSDRGSQEFKIIAIDGTNGKILWQSPERAWSCFQNLVVQGQRIYTQKNRHVVALGAKDGRQLWEAQTDTKSVAYRTITVVS